MFLGQSADNTENNVKASNMSEDEKYSETEPKDEDDEEYEKKY